MDNVGSSSYMHRRCRSPNGEEARNLGHESQIIGMNSDGDPTALKTVCEECSECLDRKENASRLAVAMLTGRNAMRSRARWFEAVNEKVRFHGFDWTKFRSLALEIGNSRSFCHRKSVAYWASVNLIGARRGYATCDDLIDASVVVSALSLLSLTSLNLSPQVYALLGDNGLSQEFGNMQGPVDYPVPPPVEGVGGGGTGYGWSEIGTRSLNTTAGVIDVNKHPTSDLLHVWSMPSTATIGHQEHPRPLEQINLLAARNEKESAQIALRPKMSWSSGGFIGHVQIKCTDLCSNSGSKLETGKAITLRRVVPILGVPDALVPLELPSAQIGLLPGETLGLWLSIEVPATQPPGYYEGEISFLAIRAESEIEGADFYEGDKLEIKKEIQEIITRAKARGNNPQEGMQAITEELRHLMQSTLLTANRGEQGKMDIDEEYNTTLAVRLKFSLTVWDYVIPVTPTLPAVFGISETVIEDRFGLEHGSIDWYKSLDMHFQWLLHYRLSPYFCRWGDNMRVLAYTCPWPADHPKAEEYYSDPRLTAYAVPYLPVLNSSDAAKESLKRELEILRTKDHWKKAYIYLWDEPLSLEQYGHIHRMAEEIRSTAPDARVLTTYYCGVMYCNLYSFELMAYRLWSWRAKLMDYALRTLI
ncbi:hypothetical protein AXG93_3384s1650 [Marchantia polymorpha subsp. ruderalis]|uniref:Uncharacterized protein n=1 Tax=Marchantia polymorpha subsp. ruderalis TaxID=1480154 RepID=A0A176WGH1_MARPO|nr:hypothetical protein AXG93_3384s1650 [Marchantia polymorpha subsp. ruderalis]